MLKQELDALGTAWGDFWHVVRVTFAETFLYFAISVMPDGSEKRTLDRCLYEYVKWVDEE